MLDRVSANERSLNDLLAATKDDRTLTKLREYAESAWPPEKQEVPEPVRAYLAYQEEIHAQDGFVF